MPLTFAVFGLFMSGKVSSTILGPLGLVAFALMAAPFVMLFENSLTIYAITNRRALIARRVAIAASPVSCAFDAMDDKLEILETGGGAGHLYFASGWSTKVRDVDHTGKLAFRDVGKVHDVAKILEKPGAEKTLCGNSIDVTRANPMYLPEIKQFFWGSRRGAMGERL